MILLVRLDRGRILQNIIVPLESHVMNLLQARRILRNINGPAGNWEVMMDLLALLLDNVLPENWEVMTLPARLVRHQMLLLNDHP